MSTKSLTPAIVCGFPYILSGSDDFDRAGVKVLLNDGQKVTLDEALDEDCNSILLDLKRGQRINLVHIAGKWMLHRDSVVLFNNRAAAISIDTLFQIKSVISAIKGSSDMEPVLDLLIEKIDNSLFDIERIEGKTQGAYLSERDRAKKETEKQLALEVERAFWKNIPSIKSKA